MKTSTMPPAVELRLTGTFDLAAARTLCDTLIAAGRARIVVDVCHARELHDDALALLGRALSLLGNRVSVHGLTRGQSRLLRYLGTPVGGGTGAGATGAASR